MSRTDDMREHFERLMYNARSPQEAIEIMREYQNALDNQRLGMLRLPPPIFYTSPIFYPSNPFTSPAAPPWQRKRQSHRSRYPKSISCPQSVVTALGNSWFPRYQKQLIE